MKTNKSYILQSLAILIMASGFFLFFKANLPEKLLSQTPLDSKHMVIDSLLLDAVAAQELHQDKITEEELSSLEQPALVDSLAVKETTKKLSLALVDKDPNFNGVDYLATFYEKLMNLDHQDQGGKTAKVRIAYYGDSMTDGDMIVQDLRAAYQKKYGGSGVGFVPITVESASSRASIKHQYGKNWTSQSYMNVKKPFRPFGVSGLVFYNLDSVASTWVSIKAGGLATMKKLEKPTLYYGRSSNNAGQMKYISDKTDTITYALNGKGILNKIKMSSTGVSELKLLFEQTDSTAIYGVDLASKAGVVVDNFSSRGNSGLPLSLLQPRLMHQFQEELDYSLIILHYGTNVLNYGSYNYSWYTRQMNRVVDHLKMCFPNASILVVSTADKSTKYDLIMQTDSAVAPLVSAQKKYAVATQSGFFKLYTAMGGKGAMVSWVEQEPVRANKDYTHFNYKGAQQVAQMLFKQLEAGYQQYKDKVNASQDANQVIDSLEKQTNNQSIIVNDTLFE